MNARRIPWPDDKIPRDIQLILKAGEYAGPWLGHGLWLCCSPAGELGAFRDNLWTVTFDAAGRTTVTPSLQFYKSDGSKGWHGYLTSDVWIQQ